MSFIQFVMMASGLGCIVKFKEILHPHIHLTKYDTITHVEVEVQPLQFQAAQLQLTQSITIGKLCKSSHPLSESPLKSEPSLFFQCPALFVETTQHS